MKQFLQQNKYFFIVMLAFIAAETCVNPFGNFPLLDDWSYAHAVLHYMQWGKINFGNFPAMTLYTQIVWGALFTKTFGFSLWLLRLSTLISTGIGLAFLNRLLVQVGGNRRVAAFCCAILLFVPMAFNMSNTFMTDINFNTLIIICCYLIYNYFHASKLNTQLLIFLCIATASILIVLLRQYGVIVPVCFIAAAFFSREKKWLHVTLSVLVLALVMYVLKEYEHYLAVELPEVSTYKFSGDVNISDPTFWQNVYESFTIKRRDILIHSLMYIMPLSLLFLVSLVKQLGIKPSAFLLLVATLLLYLLFSSEGYHSDNIFSHMILGVETFSESFRGARHNTSERFDTFIGIVKVVSVGVTLFVMLMGLTHTVIQGQWKIFFRPEIVFFVALVFSYIFMLLVTETYFDRYHIPLITLALILTAYLGKTQTIALPGFAVAFVPLVFWTYISVFGTKDYMTWNRVRWEAYGYLRYDKHIIKEKINAGFEVVCWHDGHGIGWLDFITLDHCDYLVQFNNEPGFEPIKEYEFQRYFPYKKDKIYIFVRKSAALTHSQ